MGRRYTSHTTCYTFFEPAGLEQQARISGWRRGTIVAVMWSFWDESGEHDGAGKLCRLTLGGFMAPWERIEILTQRWREALDAEGLAEFHMKEIASDEDRFAEWPTERQNRLKRFVDILCDCAVEFGAFSYVGDSRFGLFRDAYTSGFNRAYINFASFCERTGERGNIVFAKTEEISERLIGGYFARLGWGQYLDGYAVRLARNEPALQAAEIVARGMKRLMQDGGITYSFARVLIEAAKPGKAIRFWPPDAFAASVSLGHSLRVLLDPK